MPPRDRCKHLFYIIRTNLAVRKGWYTIFQIKLRFPRHTSARQVLAATAATGR
ncbi:MAG: hypothetical protein KatS3mg051_2317 [Anaerolineae bacterium]|nr:MAG: hypothetical protein KatS3mg051_2317 [Anaerolineae bacterium]